MAAAAREDFERFEHLASCTRPPIGPRINAF